MVTKGPSPGASRHPLPAGEGWGEGRHIFLVTDAAERFRRIASEFLEQDIERLELVTL